MEISNGSECNFSADPNNTSCEDEDRGPVYFNLALVAGFISIFLVGATSNLLVICVTCRHSRSRTVNIINTYILNLCTSDFLYVIGSVFFTITNYNERGWIFGDIGCRVIISLDIFTMHVSSYILALMSLERYVAVVHPMVSFQYRSVTIARWISAAIWISALLLASPMLIGMKEVQQDFGDGVIKSTCTWELFGNDDITSFFRYQLCVFFLTFLLPSVCTAGIYFLLVCHFCQSSSPEGTTKSRVRKSKKKVAKTVFVIVLCFWLCYSPFWAYTIMSQSKAVNNSFGLVSIILCYLNSCINPFLYTLLPKKFGVWSRVKNMFTGTANVSEMQSAPSRSI